MAIPLLRSHIKMENDKELQDIARELQKFIDKISETLIGDISKEIRETNKQYRDILTLAGDINARLSKW